MAYRAYINRHRNPDKRALDRRIYTTRKRLRDLGILPPVGSDMTEEEKNIYDQLGKGDFSYWDMVKKRGGIGKKLHDGGSRINSDKKTIRTPEYLLWDRLRQNAKNLGREFTISVEDIVIPEYCPYLKIKLSTDLNDYKCPNYYTGDRIDSNFGYIKGNVQVLSFLANTMKNNATIEQLVEFSKNILTLYS
jgi:hypothetical protein